MTTLAWIICGVALLAGIAIGVYLAIKWINDSVTVQQLCGVQRVEPVLMACRIGACSWQAW